MEEKFNKIYEEIIKQNMEKLELLKKESNKEKNKAILTTIIGIMLYMIIYGLMIILYNKGMINLSTYRIITISLLGAIVIFFGCSLAGNTKYEKYDEYRKKFK